jgi:hypothetical protein
LEGFAGDALSQFHSRNEEIDPEGNEDAGAEVFQETGLVT